MTLEKTPKNAAWKQLPQETDLAYKYFTTYLKMGVERSYTKVREKYGKKPSYERHIQRWGSKFNWVDRASEYDRYLIRRSLERKEQIIEEAHARLLNEADTALDELFAVLIMPMQQCLKVNYKSLVNEKLKAVDMVLNRIGIVPKKEPIEINKKQSINTYIQNIYKRIENYNSHNSDHKDDQLVDSKNNIST